MPEVLILGAGINGAAIARELTLNGISVWIVDRNDISSGTTAYSSRLIHGGLRYLEYGEIGLVYESLAERRRLLAMAPHLVRPLQFHIPVEHRSGGWLNSIGRFLHLSSWIFTTNRQRGLHLVRMGLRMYGLLARDRTLPAWKQSTVGDPAVPPVNAGRFRWVCSYWDAQVQFPERLVISMLQDASGAAREQNVDFRVLPHRQVEIQPGQVRVYPSRNTASPEVIRPAMIVNATGAWVDSTLRALCVPSVRLIGGTRGSHFLSFQPKLVNALQGSAIYAEARDGRPVFLLPFGNGALVGTTDLSDDSEPGSVRAERDEIDYLIDVVNEIFPDVQFSLGDVHRRYAGIRPLPFVSAKSTSGITRRSRIVWNEPATPPTLSVIGGKLTTCRALGEDVARQVCRRLGRPFSPHTRERSWPGCPMSDRTAKGDVQSTAQSPRDLVTRIGLSFDSASQCWDLLGAVSQTICDQVPPDELRDLVPGTNLPKAIVRWIIRHEWVNSLTDLVERRLMLVFAPSVELATLKALAQLMVAEGRIDGRSIENAVAECVADLSDRFSCLVS